ncbi:TetR family transcriptional regulator [Aeromicrobium sp. Root495]|uniref:TetR/AcrR family transcriptional regulator n=1 Tax=Aeromicrobium sp. Root495 TaxID=1736550 RepID=UPI0006F74A6B|nr:TetR/AcrR family transcriptional regulator [Aeromicrobium sp. Root495]KQY58254.1 TetR family transcriptional regulator [Aeromicrobium sp. Root495]
MSPSQADASSKASRPRGRPRLDIDLGAVADAVAQLFAEGGMDNVSIHEVAEKLSVSRATLYRTVPTKEDLLSVLFDRSTKELLESAIAVTAELDEPREQLDALIRLQIGAAIRMRGYMPVFFGGGGLSEEAYERWRQFTRDFEDVWVKVVAANMEAGDIEAKDAKIATRLMLGSCIWVSRWYRPEGPFDEEAITETAVSLLRRGLPVGEPGSL